LAFTHAILATRKLGHTHCSACIKNNPVPLGLGQLCCPTRSPQATCGPADCFAWPKLGFHCSERILHTDNLSLLS